MSFNSPDRSAIQRVVAKSASKAIAIAAMILPYGVKRISVPVR
jgi:hypothetical protein